MHFPNPSRHYNPATRCVRFRGYDDVFEIAFDVEAGALEHLSDAVDGDEAALLRVFDGNRDLIEAVACVLYLKSVQNPYRLTAAHVAAALAAQKRRQSLSSPVSQSDQGADMANAPMMHYKSWTPTQIRALRSLARQSLGVVRIAKRLKRTIWAVRNRASRERISVRAGS